MGLRAGRKAAADVVEADQAGVEWGVPECGQKQAVVDVVAVGVGPAFHPRDDVRGAEQAGNRMQTDWWSSACSKVQASSESRVCHLCAK